MGSAVFSRFGIKDRSCSVVCNRTCREIHICTHMHACAPMATCCSKALLPHSPLAAVVGVVGGLSLSLQLGEHMRFHRLHLFLENLKSQEFKSEERMSAVRHVGLQRQFETCNTSLSMSLLYIEWSGVSELHLCKECNMLYQT